MKNIHEEAYLAEGARVVGDVAIGAHSSVWYNAVIRGDSETIRIGRETNIQDNCVLHVDAGSPMTIGNGVVVGHGAILHGCTVGDSTLIGMGAVVMNGAVIGRDCIIGAGALVAERKRIPDGTLVIGCPGKCIRNTTEAERADIREGAKDYVRRAEALRRNGFSLSEA